MITQLRERLPTTVEGASPITGDNPPPHADPPAAKTAPTLAPLESGADNDSTAAGAIAEFSAMSDRGITELVKIFKLLSDETRLRILLYLMRCRELHVRALCERLGQSQPAVSHHLALLRAAGLIESRREGKHNYYHLLPRRLQQLVALAFAKMPAEEQQGHSGD